MVTKGYRKGVYDRVTEGTWEKGRVGNQGLKQLGRCCCGNAATRPEPLTEGRGPPKMARRRGLPRLGEL
jgi:hypothetical protein